MARSEAQKRADKKYEKKRAPRKDYWLFEFYPDSAPENWREIINGWLVDCLVSPLHDSDVNEDGYQRSRIGMESCFSTALNRSSRFRNSLHRLMDQSLSSQRERNATAPATSAI